MIYTEAGWILDAKGALARALGRLKGRASSLNKACALQDEHHR